jgi:hypothetical protein
MVQPLIILERLSLKNCVALKRLSKTIPGKAVYESVKKIIQRVANNDENLSTTVLL